MSISFNLCSLCGERRSTANVDNYDMKRPSLFGTAFFNGSMRYASNVPKGWAEVIVGYGNLRDGLCAKSRPAERGLRKG